MCPHFLPLQKKKARLSQIHWRHRMKVPPLNPPDDRNIIPTFYNIKNLIKTKVIRKKKMSWTYISLKRAT